MGRKAEWIKGVIMPMLTPFKGDEEVDEEALRGYTDWLIEEGVHGLFPCSSMGEFPKLSVEERKRVMEIVVDQANGRVPVYPGTGDASTKVVLDLTMFAKDLGADAAIIVEPYYFHPSEDEIFDHYEWISGEVDIPLIIYDIPEATGYSLRPELVARLAEIEGVVAIKDSSCDMIKMIRQIRLVGDKISVLQGAEHLFVASLVMGAHGGILGFCNFCPQYAVEIYESVMKGDIGKAVEIQMNLVHMMDEFAEISGIDFIMAVKQAVDLCGVPFGGVRRPGLAIKKEQIENLKKILTRFGFIQGE